MAELARPTARLEAISHYAVVRPIGRGAMGMVYEAIDTRLGREVALEGEGQATLARLYQERAYQRWGAAMKAQQLAATLSRPIAACRTHATPCRS